MIAKLSASRSALVRSLHRRKGRQEHGAYLVEGERMLEELSAAPAGLRFLLAREEHLDWLTERFPGADIGVVGKESIFATENTQGLGAVVSMPNAPTIADAGARGWPVLYLDRLADPGNVGTILRTADWFGISTVLLSPGSADPFNPKAVRATMGAIFRLSLIVDAEVEDVAALGVPIIALDASEGGMILGECELPDRAIYAVGSEAHGLDPALRAHARLLAIGGSGRGESLNAATAAGVLVYELHRTGRITAR